jgi:hypothetical protein
LLNFIQNIKCVGAQVEASSQQCGRAIVVAAQQHMGDCGVWVVEEISFGFGTLVSIFFQIANVF